MAYMTKRKIALADANWNPEMGELNSGSANYTMGLSGTVWPLHMGAGLFALALPANGCSFREIFLGSRDQIDGVGT